MSVRAIVNFCYNQLFAPLFVIAASIFLFFRIEEPTVISNINGTIVYAEQDVEKIIFFLVPATLCLCLIAISRFCFLLFDYNVYQRVWSFIVRCWLLGITYVLLGIDTLRQWMIGKILLGLAISNLFLVVYWLYYNIDLLRVFTDIMMLAKDFIVYFSNPGRVIASYINLLRSFCALSYLRSIQHSYIFPVKHSILQGDVYAIFFIIMVSVGLLACVLVLEWLRRNVTMESIVLKYRQFHREVFYENNQTPSPPTKRPRTNTTTDPSSDSDSDSNN